MTAIREGELAFSFPGDWKAGKYDEWAFYRNQLSKRVQGTKGADIVAVEPRGSAWLIEVKDYRRGGGAKASELPDEIALPAGATASAITRGADFLAVVTTDGRILIYALDGQTLRQEIRVASGG